MSTILDINMNGHQKNETKKRSRTSLDRQKESRHRMFNSHRFRYWSEGSDGYQSDDSSDSYGSTLSSDQLSAIDVRSVISKCQPNINSERIVNTCVTAVYAQLEAVWDFETTSQLVDNYFAVDFLNTMSEFIGSKSIGRSVQTKILKMFDKLVTRQELTTTSTVNLIMSRMIPKLVDTINSGSEDLIECCLTFLMASLEASPSRPDLLVHILNSGFTKVIYNRTAPLKWKSPKSKSRDMKINRVQTVTSPNLSMTSRKLFRVFSHAVIQLVNYDLPDSQRLSLFEYLVPLFSHFLSCPDCQVVNNAIHSFFTLIQKNSENKALVLSLVKNFGQTLLSMITTKDESVVLTIMQFMNVITESYPQLVLGNDFGTQLLSALNVLSERHNSKLNKEIIAFLMTAQQWVDIRDDQSRQLSDRLVFLSLIMIKASDSCDQYNRQNALISFQTLLTKYSFKALTQLIVNSFEIKAILKEMIAMNDRDQSLLLFVAKIIAQIHNIIATNRPLYPEDAKCAEQSLFEVVQRVAANDLTQLSTSL